MSDIVEQLVETCNEKVRERISAIGGVEALGIRNADSLLPALCKFTIQQSDEPTAIASNIKESMKFTMWQIYNETIIAYAMGLERITALGCRSVTERALRICFQEVTGSVADDRWSLGPLIKNCKEKGVSAEVLHLAEKIKKEGDNLAHAKYELLKHWNGIEMRIHPKNPKGPPVAHYQTGDAKACLLLTRDLLVLIFGKPNSSADSDATKPAAPVTP